jgi:outer membrane protein TolC
MPTVEDVLAFYRHVVLVFDLPDARTAEAVVAAAGRRAAAAAEAVDNLRHEVRVGEKPQLALLDAQREALAAAVESSRARAEWVAAAYRLNALLGRY